MDYEFIESIEQVDTAEWNQLCPVDYPFVRHEFLAALERSGSTCAATGWLPQHLLIRREGKLIGALPGYIKTHSYGEYVFDWAWADAYNRYGLDYYPKLVFAIPFTPCYGPRLLSRDSQTEVLITPALGAFLRAYCEQRQLSGWHCLFPGEAESQRWLALGSMARLGCQFHWFNRDYLSFDDFLATMSSRKRKNINRERRQVSAAGIGFDWLEGAAISAADWQRFYQFYCATYLKRSGHKGYLNLAFFELLGAALADNLVMINAWKSDGLGNQQVIAAALFMRDEHCLYGRYWGCLEEYQFLHFECCYYQGIDFAIARGIARFDGGAQGEHKLQRGFEPVLTHSNHWLRDSRFHQAIARAMAEEAQAVARYAVEAATYLPYKKGELDEADTSPS